MSSTAMTMMENCDLLEMQEEEPSIDTHKLSYEIFSYLETKYLFGHNDNNTNTTNDAAGLFIDDDDRRQKLSAWMIPKQVSPRVHPDIDFLPPTSSSAATSTILGASHGAGVPIGSMKNQRGKICVLSIDGGGMRNILAGKALAYLEQALKSESGNPDARIADFFDVAAGTGFGGIFTTMLFTTNDDNNNDTAASRRPLFRADDTWRLLAEKGRKIYRSSESKSGLLNRMWKTGSASALERLLKEMFTKRNGQSLTLKDTLKPVLIPCYDLSTTAPFLFSRADALETDGFDFRLWEVCRATAGEPGSWSPVPMRSVDGTTRCVGVDGGIAMSNPTAAAITHVLHNKMEFPFVRGVEDILVLSLGTTTGQVVEGSYEYERVKGWRAKEWARPVARISGEGHSDLVDQAVGMAFGQCRGSNYVRIQGNNLLWSSGPSMLISAHELPHRERNDSFCCSHERHANGSSLGRCGPNFDTDPSPSNVKMLVGVAEEMLKQKNVESVLFGGKRISEQSNAEKLDWFAGELVLEHQRRTCRIAPTVAFKQATPKPNQGGCGYPHYV
ncbi:Patatin-like protein [Drosera capensis]